MGILELLLVIILIAALFGSYPGFGWGANFGYGPFGTILAILLILVLLRVLGVV